MQETEPSNAESTVRDALFAPAKVTRLRPRKSAPAGEATPFPATCAASEAVAGPALQTPDADGVATDHGGPHGAMTARAAGINGPSVSRAAIVETGDVAAGDLGDLLAAVKERLRCTVGAGMPHLRAPAQAHGALAVRSSVLECASALDQIQTTLAHEMARRNALEQEIADTQTALEEALAELAGTRAGERHALHLAQHDRLTSLPNRAYFLERIEAELASLHGRHQALAVLCVDLEDFKPISDRYGHDMGNELLRIVGIRLSRAVRADDMVCRLGGDEFGCLLADVNGHTQLGVLAGKLIDAISAPLQIGKRKLSVQASIGIALGAADGAGPEELMRNADKAMVRAKRLKTGFAFFDAAR